jgi:hypothetical protein
MSSIYHKNVLSEMLSYDVAYYRKKSLYNDVDRFKDSSHDFITPLT